MFLRLALFDYNTLYKSITIMFTEAIDPFKPIHDSLLDTDYYQFLMLQLIYYCWVADEQAEQQRGLDSSLRITDIRGTKLPEPEVEFKLFQRGTIKSGGVEFSSLPQLVDKNELTYQFENIRKIRFSISEMNYLASLKASRGDRIFSQNFVEWLQLIELPEVKVLNQGSHFEIKVNGLWHLTLLWETYILNTVTELITRKLLQTMTLGRRSQLDGEAQTILAHSIATAIQGDITFAEFGTRRRASKDWQRYVTQQFRDKMARSATGRMIGTSNVLLAKELQLAPIGTMAHQLFMVFASLLASKDNQQGQLDSQRELVSKWWQLYGVDKSIWLPDTYTTETFLKVVDPKMMIGSKGFRQDSGDPNVFAQIIYDYLFQTYKDLTDFNDHEITVAIRQKAMLFSDGLTMEKALELKERWCNFFSVSFGIGTSLTNNLGSLGNRVDLAVKPTTLNYTDPMTIEQVSRGILKVSDSPLSGRKSKVTGDQRELQRFIELINSTMHIE